jgi:hypothetical protein
MVHVGHVVELELPVPVVFIAVASGPQFDLTQRRTIDQFVDTTTRLA